VILLLLRSPFINDFESDNQSGTPRLIVDTTKHSPRSIQSFTSGLTDVSLAPGQSQNVTLTVRVPQTASPGGYYGALRYAAVPQNVPQNTAERQISLTASVATLVLIEVNGPVTESLNFQSLQVIRNSDPGTFFFGKAPDHIAISLKNGGNGFSQPIGRVTINKGKKQVYSYEFNTNNAGLHSTILPNSTRTFTDPIKNVTSFGHYKIMASLAYKQGGATITLTKSFWVIPKIVQYSLLGLILLIVILVVLWRVAEDRGRRTRRR
jgi:hypothetical protein